MSFTIAADHPCLPGHFPGQPIVPGVVLLAEIFSRIEAAHPGQRVAALLHAKFLIPLRPEEVMTLSFAPGAEGRVNFQGHLGGARALQGAVRLTA